MAEPLFLVAEPLILVAEPLFLEDSESRIGLLIENYPRGTLEYPDRSDQCVQRCVQ